MLSVVMPVYNESRTVSAVLHSVLDLRLQGVDVEVVVVESNSTDGTREIVGSFAAEPRVRIIYEDAPRGKGRAVRTAFGHVRGDIVLIQDGDLEYDFADYPRLLKPIQDGEADFVLGTRHARGNGMHIRKFEHSRAAAFFYNTGHWVLTWLINALYLQKLTDPFTMFKVFRRQCLDGLTFECNRFDFDCELLCKLIRRGFNPVEVPVRYSARTFEEGKKVRTFGDPPTWIRAILKYRFSRVG
jgi:glycosyltransferase involved in cell wall biosynthesis